MARAKEKERKGVSGSTLHLSAGNSSSGFLWGFNAIVYFTSGVTTGASSATHVRVLAIFSLAIRARSNARTEVFGALVGKSRTSRASSSHARARARAPVHSEEGIH